MGLPVAWAFMWRPDGAWYEEVSRGQAAAAGTAVTAAAGLLQVTGEEGQLKVIGCLWFVLWQCTVGQRQGRRQRRQQQYRLAQAGC
jgi:hypothetical protein